MQERGESMSKGPGVGKEQDERKIRKEVWLEQRESKGGCGQEEVGRGHIMPGHSTIY